jgi:hypothetical protein
LVLTRVRFRLSPNMLHREHTFGGVHFRSEILGIGTITAEIGPYVIFVSDNLACSKAERANYPKQNPTGVYSLHQLTAGISVYCMLRFALRTIVGR